MSWQVPISADLAWQGEPWQELEWLNHMVRGTNMRLATVYALTSAAHGEAIPEIEEGDAIQSLSYFLTLRESALGELAFVKWVEPGPIATGDDPTLSDRLYSNGAGEWAQLYLDAVNAKLTEWGCDAMGPTILAGGKIPWTRRTGGAYRPGGLGTDFGDLQRGDWLTGRHLYNEWRACLEVLTDVFMVPTMGTDAAYEQGYVGGVGEEDSCASAKSGVNAEWASYSPVGATIVRAEGSTSGDEPGSWIASFGRTWTRYTTTKANLANGVETTLFAVARPPPGATFNSFSEGWVHGEVGQVETVGAPDGSPSAFDVDPFSVSSCDIDDVTCSISGAAESEGYQVEVEGVIYTLEYPEPAYTAPTPDPFYPV